MIYKIIKKDLFDMVYEDYYFLAHCVNATYELGAGIAKTFDEKYNMKYLLRSKFPQPKNDEAYYVGKALLIGITFNLVTKVKHWHKPTYENLHKALEDMRRQCEEYGIKKLAMPKIGCGLDRLSWDEVESIIFDVFNDCDIEIVICYL